MAFIFGHINRVNKSHISKMSIFLTLRICFEVINIKSLKTRKIWKTNEKNILSIQ